ncbi:hypothetical protein [Saccharibacillus kuerlensis]|uniref:Uncharacterized protein n=1 Tax=Saccharibacillus kuerlensis TaxID=459527 RepID=A0ABQ2L6I6_9BACL|nr:hypothetical protein [Saccharibacillus kuerlensis]GGO02536.1 hypothetical protein GCM10010969_25960 [Saccharibacillus kuerlensis]
MIGNEVIKVYDEVVDLLGPRFAGDEDGAWETVAVPLIRIKCFQQF